MRPNVRKKIIVVMKVDSICKNSGTFVQYLLNTHTMNPLTAYCGIDCETCEARIATIKDDNNLREELAKKWSEMFQAEIPVAAINCNGCRMDGVKFSHCNNCEIRKCAQAKNFNTCGDCPELDSCATISQLLEHVPGARERLGR